MLQILDIQAHRGNENPHPTPEGHWVGLVFKNAFGTHVLELNGRKPLPDHDPQLRADLEFLLWDYGLLSQQDSETPEERIRAAQALWHTDRNHAHARRYMERLGVAAGAVAA
ncbi:hypothetical protein QTH97_26270 [Variovorax sp. J22R24]|uniref:hypothetical protein n=1 Tax=Variovorax gracilis TaxID=3053502 RepID=UPI002574B561|nr:hypothetical protein [Variovorax sp. J22R24]MDM0108482.1 hypothetical protein [Variovorax sp. J22R24]